MATSNGGRWIFSPPTGFSEAVIGFGDGTGPVAQPVPGAFNIEAFIDPSLDKLIDTKIDVIDRSGNIVPILILPDVPAPGPGFQTSIADIGGGTIENGYLTGTSLRLTTGDFLVVDWTTGAAKQSASKMTLGSGNQTVVGAKFDTLIGGSGTQILSALLGNQTVVGGTGNESIWGGANDSIVGSGSIAGSGRQQIVVSGTGTTVVAGNTGNATISLAAQDTVTVLPGSAQNIAIAAGQNNLIDLTGGFGTGFSTGFDAVIGASGDTITAGGGTTNIEGAAGGMQIKVGPAGTTNLSGSAGLVAGNTIAGGAGNLAFNPGNAAGKGDLIDLSGSAGTATINAFAFGATRVTSHDTILGTNNGDSVFGGDGDRIGTGKSPVVGGTHQWVHADTVAGSAVGFGSNDTIASTSYDTVSGTATRGTVAGTSSALVTVGGFNPTADFIFYQNESGAMTSAIIATSQAATVVGLTQGQLTAALFKP